MGGVVVALIGCATTTRPVPKTWTALPRATQVSPNDLARITGVTVLREKAPTSIRNVDGQLVDGAVRVTEKFDDIQSFDVHQARGEVIFSAKREHGYDIGLAATDGSKTNWLPADPADELDVVWAPRGNKVSYVVRAKSGDFVRTLHIPTATALSVEFPLATVHALAWEPQAEKYAVAVSSATTSPHAEFLKYDGRERSVVIPPSARIDAEVDLFGPDAIVLRPRELQYNERLPVVVWLGDPHVWSDARAALFRGARVGLIVTEKSSDELYARIGETKWLDGSRMYVVGARREGAMSIVSAPSVAGGRYRVDDTVVSAAPDVIESLAAGFIADQLKRTDPTNGSSR
jgi:hypothetical protein